MKVNRVFLPYRRAATALRQVGMLLLALIAVALAVLATAAVSAATDSDLAGLLAGMGVLTAVAVCLALWPLHHTADAPSLAAEDFSHDA